MGELRQRITVMEWIRQIVEDLKREEEHRRWVEERKRLLEQDEEDLSGPRQDFERWCYERDGREEKP